MFSLFLERSALVCICIASVAMKSDTEATPITRPILCVDSSSYHSALQTCPLHPLVPSLTSGTANPTHSTMTTALTFGHLVVTAHHGNVSLQESRTPHPLCESCLVIRCMHLPMNFLYFIKYFAVEKCPKKNDLLSEDECQCQPQNATDWLRADVKRCKSLEQTLFTATKFQ